MFFWRDFRYGVRLLTRDQAFTLVAVFSLGLAIGVNAVVFSVVDAVLFRPFPYRDQERLVLLWGTKSFDVRRGLSGSDLENWRVQTRTLENIVPLQLNSFPFALGQDDADQVRAAYVGTQTFSLLGAKPLLGRTFAAAEEEPGGEKTALLSHRLWQSRFGGDPGAVGQTVRLSGDVYTILGVMPVEFFFPDQSIQLWLPINKHIWVFSQVHGLARLRPGVTLAQAQAELDALGVRREDAERRVSPGVFPLLRLVVGEYQTALWTLLAAVGAVLLIACMNVASLLMARGVQREKEFAVRAALGAGRRRIFSQLLTENLLVAFAGGTLGCVLGYWGLQLMQRAQLTDIPRMERATMDVRVLFFCAGVSLLSGGILGLAPAWKASRSNLADSLKQGGTTSGQSGRGRLREFFVMVEAALVMALLVVTGLLVNSFVRLSTADWGFQPEGAFAVSLDFPARMHDAPQLRSEFVENLLDRVEKIPGTEAVGVGYGVPVRWGGWSGANLRTEGRFATGDWTAGMWVVGRGYFRTLGIPVLKGREFAREDDAGAERTVIVSTALATKLWPGEEPIGKHLSVLQLKRDLAEQFRKKRPSQSELRKHFKDPDAWEETPPRLVVGLVGNVRMFGLELEPFPAFYVNYRQQSDGLFKTRGTLVVRGTGSLSPLSTTVKRTIQEVEPGVTITEVATMQDLVNESIGGHGSSRLLFLVSTTFGILALVLAVVGIYGVMAYTVSQRTQEIGLRMALGAKGENIFRMILGRGARLALFGLALGATVAWASTRVLSKYLFGITPTDPLTFALAALLLFTVAMLACYLPASRAARIDPIVALRYE